MATLDVLQIKVQSQGITENTRQLDNLGKSADNTEKKVLKLVESVDKMVAKFGSSASGTKALTDALAVVNKTTSLSDNAMKNLTSSVDKLSQHITTMNAKMQAGHSIVRTSTVHIEHHARAMSDAHAAARGLTGSLGALWLTYGNVAPLAAGAAIGASLKAIVTIGADVENTLEAIRLKTGATTDEMTQLTRVISDMGKSIYGPQEIAKALETLSLAGLNATQAATAVGAALNLATSGGTSIEKSAESLVTIGTAVGATADQYDYLADAIQKTANISLASVDSISESVKRASVVNKLYGASFEDILTQTAALSQLGIKNSAAGTAITNFYANAMGNTDKAKKALDALGFSFQDATGKAKEIVPAFEEFSQKLNQFDTASQKKIISDIFGERALRDVEALRDLTLKTVDGVSGLAKIQADIKNAAGSAVLIAAEQALTTENQFKSMSNTLKSVFGEAFKEIQPQVDSIIRKLKELFASEQFQTVVTNLAKAFANMAEFIVSNIKPLTAVAEGFLAVGAATAGGALFSKMIAPLQGVAVLLGTVGTAANGAAIATGALGTAIRFLPGIGIVLGLVTAAWALYTTHTEKATEATKDLAEETKKAAEQYSGDFLKSLDDQIDRLTRVNAALRTGTSLQEANNKATAEGALTKQRAMFTEAEAAAMKVLVEEEQKLATIRKNVGFNYTKQSLVTDQIKAVTGAQDALNKAKEASAKFDTEALKKAQKVVDLTKQQQDQIEINTRSAEFAAAGRVEAGAKTFDPKAEQAAAKALSFLEQERLDLKKVTAGYEARTAALIKSFDAGVNLAAEAREAIVEVNKAEGKYASEAAYNSQLLLAREADKKKLIYDNTKAYVEFGIKLNGIVEAEKNYNSEGDKTYGNLRRQAEAMIKVLNLDIKRAAALRELADASDKINKSIDSRNRLERATENSKERAEKFADELVILEKYGVAAKQTAVEFAKAELAKRGFEEGSREGKDRLAAGGLEDMNLALLNLQKTYEELSRSMMDQEGLSLDNVVGIETAKVAVYENTKNKLIEFEEERARAAIEIQLATGAISQDVANKALADLEARLNKVRGLLKDKLTLDFKIAGLKDISNIFDDMAESAGQLGKGFEKSSKALSGFSGAFNKLAKSQEMERKKAGEGEAARIGAYGDMAQAAGMFFSENSKGYQAATAAAKVLHAAELALNVVKGINAILTQGSGDPYSAFGRMAAMTAIVVGLGVAIGGGVSGSGGASAESVQESQGTGSVFGGSKAKSESINRSIEALESNSSLMLPLTQGMLSALKNIEASMAGLANLVVGANIANAENMNLNLQGGTNSISKFISGLGGSTPFGKILGGITSAIFGKTTKNLVDSGITFGGKVSDLQQGQGFNQYASIDTTKKSLFGLIKKTTNSVQTQALDKELSNQFGLIFTNLEDALKTAAGGFGKTGQEVGDAVANTVIESTKLSLKDLKGDELTSAINAVISKAMDDIAQNAFPGLDAFRKVGEGYAQTVIRVSSGIEQANVALEKFNINAINYVDIVNKQGDVASEIFKQSVLAVEQFNGVRDIVKMLTGDVSELADTYAQLKDVQKQLTSFGLNGGNLSLDTIKGAGGLDNLQKGLQDFFDSILTGEQQLAIKTVDLTKSFADLGYAVPTSKKAFADLIKSIDDGSVSGNKLVGRLLMLSDAFGEVSDAAEDAAKSAAESAERRRKEAIDAAMSLVSGAFDALKRSVAAQKGIIKGAYDAEVAFIKAAGEARKKAAQTQLEQAKEYLSAIDKVFSALSGAIENTVIESTELDKVRRINAQNYLQSVQGTDLTKATGLDSALSGLSGDSKGMFSTFEDYARDQAKTVNLLSNLKEQAGVEKTMAELTIDRLDATIEAIEKSTQASLDAAQARYEAEISKLDTIVENAQKQIDILNGINTSILSVKDALNAFSSAINNANAVKAGAGGSMAGGTGSGGATGLGPRGEIIDSFMTAWWENTPNDFLRSGKSSIPSFDIGTNYIPSDMMAMVHEGERIVPKADNAELMRRLSNEDMASDKEEIKTLLKQLVDVTIKGDVANVQQTSEVKRILKKFDQEGLPATRDVEV